MECGSWGWRLLRVCSRGEGGGSSAPLLGSPPFSTAPPPAKLTCSPVGEHRDFTQDSRDLRLRTADHGFTQTLRQVTKSEVLLRKTDNCLSVQPPAQPEGAFCSRAGRAGLPALQSPLHTAQDSAYSTRRPMLTPALHSASTLKFLESLLVHQMH